MQQPSLKREREDGGEETGETVRVETVVEVPVKRKKVALFELGGLLDQGVRNIALMQLMQQQPDPGKTRLEEFQERLKFVERAMVCPEAALASTKSDPVVGLRDLKEQIINLHMDCCMNLDIIVAGVSHVARKVCHLDRHFLSYDWPKETYDSEPGMVEANPVVEALEAAAAATPSTEPEEPCEQKRERLLREHRITEEDTRIYIACREEITMDIAKVGVLLETASELHAGAGAGPGDAVYEEIKKVAAEVTLVNQKAMHYAHIFDALVSLSALTFPRIEQLARDGITRLPRLVGDGQVD